MRGVISKYVGLGNDLGHLTFPYTSFLPVPYLSVPPPFRSTPSVLDPFEGSAAGIVLFLKDFLVNCEGLELFPQLSQLLLIHPLFIFLQYIAHLLWSLLPFSVYVGSDLFLFLYCGLSGAPKRMGIYPGFA